MGGKGSDGLEGGQARPWRGVGLAGSVHGGSQTLSHV